MRSLCIALLTHNRIVTTLPKAKELRRYVEPLITRGKEDTMHNRREAFSFLQDNKTVSKLFDEIGPKVGERPGGYTRVVRVGLRVGDSAERAVIELVDYNDILPGGDVSKKKKRTRRGASGKTKAVAAVAAAAPVVEAAATTSADETESADVPQTLDADVISEEPKAD